LKSFCSQDTTELILQTLSRRYTCFDWNFVSVFRSRRL